MKVIKKLYTKKIDGKEKTLPSYFILTDEGKKIMIKPVFQNDWPLLNFISDFVSEKKND